MVFDDEIANAFVSILDDCDTKFKGRLSCVPRTSEDLKFVKTFLDQLGMKYTVSDGVASTMHGTKDDKKTIIMEKSDKQPETSWRTIHQIFTEVQGKIAANRRTILSMQMDFDNTTTQQKMKNATNQMQTEIMARRTYLNSLAGDQRK